MKFEHPFKSEAKKEKPKLADLDVRGREIFGLESRPERFSRLVPGRDLEILVKAGDISSESDLDEAFVFVNPSAGEESLPVEPPHWRTVTKRGINATREPPSGKDFFYATNTKGVGYLKPTVKGGRSLDEYGDWNRVDEYEREGGYGIADAEEFYQGKSDVIRLSRKFADEGMRVEMYYYVGKLKSVYYRGKQESIDSLRRKKIIPSSRHLTPEIAIRLFKTNARVAEAADSDDPRAKELMREGFDVFNRETKDKGLGFPELRVGEPGHEKIFFKEFFRRMGRNLAAFQNTGYIGWHVHSSNITLAAEIADIGSYMHHSYYEEYEDADTYVKKYSGVRRGTLKDMRDFAYNLREFIGAAEHLGMSHGEMQELVDVYLQSFHKALDPKKIAVEGLDVNQLFSVAEKITTAVLIDGKHLSSLKQKKADIQDWNLGL